MENISMGGFFLRIDIRRKLGEKIAVEIFLQNDLKNVNIVTNATAFGVEEGGIAFRFDETENYNYWTLRSYLHYLNA